MKESEVQIILKEPHPGQLEILNNRSRFNVVTCGRRWGKSQMAVELICETVLPGGYVGYFAPTYKLLDGTYNECLATFNPIINRKHEHQFIELITGGRIEFWSLENELAGRSRKYHRTITDESAFVKDLYKKWTESIRATLTDFKGDAYFLSTPKGKNDHYKLHMRGVSCEANWKSWQMSTYTNPHIDPEEIDDAKRDLPELAFSQEYMAEFNDNVANPFGYTYIQQCIYPISIEPPVVFGIDLAKKHDWTVIVGLDRNGSVCYFDRFQMSWRETKHKITALPNITMIVDSTGSGDPIVEDLQRDRSNVNGFMFTSRSKQQIMEGLQYAIQQRKISFPHGMIVEELNCFEYEYTRTGVKYSAPAGLNDDCVCALALAVHGFNQGVSNGGYSVSFI